MEEWRSIPGFPGYLVSNQGRLASIMAVPVDRTLNLVTGTGKGQKGKGRLTKRHTSLARAVLEAFVGPPDEGAIARHLNDDPADNRLENLAWGTRKDNAEDARRNGRLAIGARSGTAKLTHEAAVEILRRYRAGEHYTKIAADYPISSSHVLGIGRGRFWKHIHGE